MTVMALERTSQDNHLIATALQELPSYPAQAADVIRPLLNNLDIDTYKHFLHTMYHYTRNSGQKALDAAKKCDDPAIAEYFAQVYREERGHYLLAQRDYEAFGLEIDPMSVPECVRQFDQYWYGLGTRNCNEFVGGMYVFESVANLVGVEVMAMLKRLKLSKKQSRWLLVHLEADQDHGSHAFEMCEKYIKRDPEALLDAAREGTKYWINVFKYALA